MRAASSPGHVSRRQVLKATAASLLGLSAPRVVSAAADESPPDVVLVILDALRAASLPLHGSSRDTAPFLESLARESTVFKYCYSTALWTRPAVTGLLSGLLPIEHGQWRFGKRLPAEMETFPRALSRRGYRTGFFTANSVVGEKFGLENHFDHVSDRAAVERDPGSWLTRECEGWARAQDPSAPLFVWAHYLPPHGPCDPPTRYLDEMLAQGLPEVDYLPHHFRDVDVSFQNAVFGRIPWYQAKVSFSTDPRHYLLRYEANVRYADALARELFARWRALGRGRRTIFVVTSDHGECVGEHGLFFAHGRLLHDSILRVPLIVHDTADPGGRTVEEPVSHLDLTASLLDWAGAPERLGSGRPLREAPRQAALPVLGLDFAAAGESGWALTRGRLRLVYNDCPRWGGAHLLDVRAGVPMRRHGSRVPLPVPATALAEPVDLAPGITLEELALHATWVEAGEPTAISGVLRARTGTEGAVELRQRHIGTGEKPLLLLRRPARDTGPFSTVLRPPLPPPGRSIEVVIEARFATGAGGASDAEWRRLFSFPVCRTQEFAPGIDLVGVSLEPAVARPGETVIVRSIWRLTRRLPPGAAVEVALVAPDDARSAASGVVAEARGREAKAAIAALANLPAAPAERGLRVIGTSRITVPGRAPAGFHRVVARASGLAFRATGPGASATADPARPPGVPAIDPAGEITLASLDVVETPEQVLSRLVERDLGFAHYAALADLAANGDLAQPLATLARRFPAEGHPLYLLALGAAAEETRRELLESCLARVPWHRGAAAALAGSSGRSRAVEVLDALTPPLALDYRFENCVRLFGAALERAPDGTSGLDLTLYWEALAPLGEPLEAVVRVRSSSPGGTAEGQLSHLLGQGVRPNHMWRVGECVVEVVRLPSPPSADRVVVELSLHRGDAYDEPRKDTARRESSVLVARHSAGVTRARVRIASAALTDLPRAPLDRVAAKRRSAIWYHLYDVGVDPAETHDLVEERPEDFAALRDELIALLERDWTVLAEGPDVEIPAATVERLRAMGYAE